MVDVKSLELIVVITTLLEDVSRLSGLFTPRALKLTQAKACARFRAEGPGFLTKTLASLGKSFDKALAGHLFDYTGWEESHQGKFPMFMGELFAQIFDCNGLILKDPRLDCIRYIRQVCYTCYKYEIPFEDNIAVASLTNFKQVDDEVRSTVLRSSDGLVRRARMYLTEVFSTLDLSRIDPKHGPGAVADKATFAGKYKWSSIPQRLANVYPIDAHFYASPGHLCDSLQGFLDMSSSEPRARVILVPKDSRGPRVISAEPKELQWIQQGMMRAMVKHIEANPLTRGSVNFTDQSPNRDAALEGSIDGRYATLDLKEASDRISLQLVQRIWPRDTVKYLLAARCRYTCLPNQETVRLAKYAPMGSALCFPVLAMSIWALLRASGIPKDSILVYGDDVIVPREVARYAMNTLEDAGLKINVSKSCTSGLFRESCGMDAYNGVDVTPVRLRTVWSDSPSAGPYSSFVAYANEFYHRGYSAVASLLATRLVSVYGPIRTCDKDTLPGYPCFSFCIEQTAPQPKARYNPHLQRLEYRVLVEKTPEVVDEIDGWQRLLRFFTESGSGVTSTHGRPGGPRWSAKGIDLNLPRLGLRTNVYTDSRRSMLRRTWR